MCDPTTLLLLLWQRLVDATTHWEVAHTLCGPSCILTQREGERCRDVRIRSRTMRDEAKCFSAVITGFDPLHSRCGANIFW